jgi:hypothetical protein
MMITVFLRKTNGKGQKLHIEQKSTVQHLLSVAKEALNTSNEKSKKKFMQMKALSFRLTLEEQN